METTDYNKQATDFLTAHSIKFTATATENNPCPLWCDGKHVHGDQYRITFSRDGKRLQLMFWNSLNDRREGKNPQPYDVLAGITKNDPCDFDNFCSEFGYDTYSRKAEKTYKLVVKEWEKVSRFFSVEELEELSEIN